MMNLRRPAPPTDPRAERERIRRALMWPMLGAGILIAIHALQELTGGDWSRLGILPRDAVGVLGIITSPLIHGSWGHLLANVPTLWVLGMLTLYGFPQATRTAVPLIWLMGGLGVWLFAREGLHIGASGLTHGLMFFAVVIGIRRRDALSIALAIIILFLYGSMLWGVFPSGPKVSFEAHLFGAVVGAVCGGLLYRRDPLPPARRSSWEDDDETDPETLRKIEQGRLDEIEPRQPPEEPGRRD
ncbi:MULTISPECIES: rhomboid family intramembrane serine protease [unclassified Thioalkalivibrio]|uniref:rhomboid family intramembrane serine protease n=1 Tax=unclassified Thioalkalivibrio TaxID=2621013 RepID=UPI000195A98B|nr:MULTISPECIES: rhomboid family intramembrane serine protease [unclassified Thioalkalivibrio]ADC70537.1 Rhomboid family protein [Thioalkalivibrio sp. K90mix]